MTTIDHRQGRTDEEWIAEAHAALEELRQLDICDPLELTRPFRQFSTQLSAIGETLHDVAFVATIDDGVRRRVEHVLEQMSAAARLVETAALATLFAEDRLASAGGADVVRGDVEAAQHLRVTDQR